MKVLFIGNSHTYFNDMPHTFSVLYESGTKETVDAVMLAHPGRDFKWHMKEYYEIRYNLLYGKYDYCIMQQAAHPFPGENTTLENGKILEGLCKSVGTTPIFTVTWAEKAHPENQKTMNQAYNQLKFETGALLSPVGLIWENIRNEHPEIELFWKDGEHASPYGDYLIACSHYRLISGNKAVGLPYYGIDFLQNTVAGAESGKVIENIQELVVDLDKEKSEIIQRYVDKFFLGYDQRAL